MSQPITSPHIPGLTAVRGLAALTVVLFHAYAIASYPANGSMGAYDLLGSGYLAVDVFYVLSGCVLFLPTARRGGFNGSYGSFVFRRVTRLWPCYAIVVVVTYLLHAQQGVPAADLPPTHGGWLPLISHALLLPTATGLQHLGFGLNPVLWSISVEMCFSLILPLIAGWWFRHPFSGLAVAVVISRVWVFVVTHVGPGAANLRNPLQHNGNFVGGANLLLELPTYAAHFGLGMTLAWVFARHGSALRTRFRGVEWLLLAAGAVGCLAVAIVLGRNNLRAAGGFEQWTSSWPLLAPLGLLLLGVLLAAGRTARILDSRVLRFLGDISYPLYLLHVVVMRIATNSGYPAGWRFFGINVATVPVSILLAWALHTWVESPASDWGRRVSGVKAATGLGPYLDLAESHGSSREVAGQLQ